jgi:hypothetical protein
MALRRFGSEGDTLPRLATDVEFALEAEKFPTVAKP